MVTRERMMTAKRCADCGQAWKAEAFSAGDPGRCKECYNAKIRLRRRSDPKFQARERAFEKKPHRRALNRILSARWKKEHPDQHRAPVERHPWPASKALSTIINPTLAMAGALKETALIRTPARTKQNVQHSN
jgi:hypothetical protein